MFERKIGNFISIYVILIKKGGVMMTDLIHGNTIVDLRKKDMLEVIFTTKMIQNKSFIITLLLGNSLDNLIEKLSDEETVFKVNSFVTKGYLTSSEQFLSILDNFISYLLDVTNNYGLAESVFPRCIESKYSDILLDKRYYHDYEFMDDFVFKFQLMIIDNFYYNLVFLKDEIEYEIKKSGIDIDNIDLNNSDDVSSLIDLLGDLCFINCAKKYMLLSLFSKASGNLFNITMHYESLFENYFKYKDLILLYHDIKDF